VKVADSVRHALDELDRGNTEAGMLHACNAVDGTARKVFPKHGNRARFTALLRDYYWVLGPAGLPGVDLRTRFIGAGIADDPEPDLATVVYKIHRCTHGHGDELPDGYALTRLGPEGQSRLEMSAQGVLRLPSCLPYGLLFVAVLASVNAGQSIGSTTYYLELEGNRFVVDDYFGRADLVRPVIDARPRMEVLLDLSSWKAAGADPGEATKAGGP
jgi:hypothetical protein